jgi:hypothetical protein
MATYAIETDVEGMVGYAIGATSRPTTTELAVMLTQADAIINADLVASSNLTDTYGILKANALSLVSKMINNLFFLAEPDNYDYQKVELSDDERRRMLKAHSRWAVLSWELGE